jgi:hypothetical protein
MYNYVFLSIILQTYLINAVIIKNINVPSCRNCIYYKPEVNDFHSELSRCMYFGEKNIQTDIISYEYAYLCRSSENKCGLQGKYFEQEPNVDFKFFLHNIKNSKYKIVAFIILIYIYAIVK